MKYLAIFVFITACGHAHPAPAPTTEEQPMETPVAHEDKESPSCKKFFDGCNTCIVGDDQKTRCTTKYCEPGYEKNARCLDNDPAKQP